MAICFWLEACLRSSIRVVAPEYTVVYTFSSCYWISGLALEYQDRCSYEGLQLPLGNYEDRGNSCMKIAGKSYSSPDPQEKDLIAEKNSFRRIQEAGSSDSLSACQGVCSSPIANWQWVPRPVCFDLQGPIGRVCCSWRFSVCFGLVLEPLVSWRCPGTQAAPPLCMAMA